MVTSSFKTCSGHSVVIVTAECKFRRLTAVPRSTCLAGRAEADALRKFNSVCTKKGGHVYSLSALTQVSMHLALAFQDASQR